MTNAIEIHEQKINGRVRERLTINHSSGMAAIEHLDENGAVVGRSTCSAGSGEVKQFIIRADA